MRKNAILNYLALFTLLLSNFIPQAGLALTDVADGAVKSPPLVPEESVSTYVPSKSAGEKGVAVNVILPEAARYPDGAPVVVVAPGGNQADGLSFTMHAAQQGFVEVRLAFPGGGKAKFSSGGIYDYRGAQSQLAFKDVILFAAGKIADSQGRHIADLVPMRVSSTDVGIVGWSNGGNIAMMTMAKYPDDLSPIVSWIAFYESPIGPLFYPPNLGGAGDLFLNSHYAQGSSATGECKVDWKKLKWDGEVLRNAGEHRKRGEPELRGVLYFDENNNGKWDEPSEYALNYALDVGLDRQIYPPEPTHALELSGVFVKYVEDTRRSDRSDKSGNAAKGGKKKGDDKAAADADDRTPAKVDAAEKSQAKEAPADKSDANDGAATDARDGATKSDAKGGASKSATKGGAKSQGAAAKKKGKLRRIVSWPGALATLAESESYFEDRDGSLSFGTIASKYPNLMITILATQIDHLQRQPDHPHITLQYNAWLANKAHWVRLNPDPVYPASIATMHLGNFTYNKPNSPIDAATITTFLEPEGITKDYVLMEAAIAELADRRHSKSLKTPLQSMITPYYNSANPAPPVKPTAAGASAPAKPSATTPPAHPQPSPKPAQ